MARRPIHLLIVSNTDLTPFVQGADRDWVNLLNAMGPENVRVTWVGIRGSQEFVRNLDERLVSAAIDIDHPCFYELVPDNAFTERSWWLWTKILAGTSLALGRSYFQLKKALGPARIDLVITNTSVVLLGAVFARLTRRPHIWNIKEYLDPELKSSRRFAKIITRLSSAIVVPSKVIGEAFKSRLHILLDGGNIQAIEGNVRRSREEVLRSLDLPQELPLVAQVGAISQRKGQYLTALAFVELACKGGPPTFSLVFFGAGKAEDLERLKAILSGAPAEWRALVRFSIFQQDDLSPLAAADILVHPSTFQDAFPNAVREAMILGKPVIGSALGGIPDMIVDNVNGVLIRPEDPKALETALERLVAQPCYRQALGEAAAEHSRKHFDVNVRKLAFLDLLRQLQPDQIGESS